MFYSCSSLKTLNVSNWNTKKVTNMSLMFADCDGLTILDLSNWDTENVTDMGSMFSSDDKLKTIYASNRYNPDKVIDSQFMFGSCRSLVA